MDKIYADVYSMLVFIASIISVAIVGTIASFGFDPVVLTTMVLVLGIDVLIGLSYVLSIIRQKMRATY